MKLSKVVKRVLKPSNLLKLFAVIILILLFNFCTCSREGFEGANELILFHMNDCGHCKTLMPEWEKFVDENSTNIATRSVELNDDPSLVKKYKIDGFPTIILIGKGGKKLDTYEGPRTAAGLLAYVKKVKL
jgi:thiol-disulfide isomerase/thioredoxin